MNKKTKYISYFRFHLTFGT